MKTDIQIQQDVIAELKWEPSVNAAKIAVEVNDGIVSLIGNVSSYGEECDAEQAARRVSGVKALVITMNVVLIDLNKRSDTDITHSLEHFLLWTTHVPKNTIKVLVKKGWVNLTGQLDWEFQRQTVARAVRYLVGVTGFTDSIAIRPKMFLSAAKSDIEAALKRRTQVDTQNISIDIQGANVTLTGTVHSWEERDAVRLSAWRTPGVRNVVDNITVAYQ